MNKKILLPLVVILSITLVSPVFASSLPIKVWVDIKPGSCPNSLNVNSKGVLPIAIIGAEEFDVMTIDPSSILISLDTNGGVSPLRWSWEDVNGDGILDLALKFDTQEVVSTLTLTDDAGVIPLTISGFLLDGRAFMGVDYVRLLQTND